VVRPDAPVVPNRGGAGGRAHGRRADGGRITPSPFAVSGPVDDA